MGRMENSVSATGTHVAGASYAHTEQQHRLYVMRYRSSPSMSIYRSPASLKADNGKNFGTVAF